LQKHADTDTYLEMFEDEYDLFDNGDLILVSSKVFKVDSYGNEVSHAILNKNGVKLACF
jgi:hypothetical protein